MSAVLWLARGASMAAGRAPGPQARERRAALGIALPSAHDLESERGESLGELALGHEMIRMERFAVTALAFREGLVHEAATGPKCGSERSQERAPEKSH